MLETKMYKLVQRFFLWIIMMNIEYGMSNDKVKDLNGRIIGGDDALPGEFPWMVGIYMRYEESLKYRFICAGTIINNQWVVTAVPCIKHPGYDAITLQIGKTHLNDVGPNEKFVEHSLYIIHPEFRSKPDSINNIALIKLTEPLVFNQDVGPISISKRGDNFENEICITTGWGITHMNDGYYKVKDPNMKKVPDKIWPAERCVGAPNNLCSAGLPDGGTGACIGDSGGPVQCQVEGKYVLAGIISHGRSCGEPSEPDFSTNISHYHDWIIDEIARHS